MSTKLLSVRTHSTVLNDREIQDRIKMQDALAKGLVNVRPTDDLMKLCYATLQRFGLEPIRRRSR